MSSNLVTESISDYSDSYNEEWWLAEEEEFKECHACFGTGMDRILDSDCLECFGDGVI